MRRRLRCRRSFRPTRHRGGRSMSNRCGKLLAALVLRTARAVLALAFQAALLGAAPVGGHNALAPEVPTISRAQPQILNDVGIDQHRGAALPLDAVFNDET